MSGCIARLYTNKYRFDWCSSPGSLQRSLFNHHLSPLCSQLPQAEQEGPEERQRQTAAPPAGQGGRQHRGERFKQTAAPDSHESEGFQCFVSVNEAWRVPSPPGVGFQLSAEEGLPERSDALWDASPGCLHHPVAGPRPAREIWERVQVRNGTMSPTKCEPSNSKKQNLEYSDL